MVTLLQLLTHLSTLANAVVRPLRWLALAMVLLTFAIVILRYALNTGDVLLQESVMYLHGAFFMLAIALGVGENTHVRVDIFYSRLTPDQQGWIDLAGHILFLLPGLWSGSAYPMSAIAGGFWKVPPKLAAYQLYFCSKH